MGRIAISSDTDDSYKLKEGIKIDVSILRGPTWSWIPSTVEINPHSEGEWIYPRAGWNNSYEKTTEGSLRFLKDLRAYVEIRRGELAKELDSVSRELDQAIADLGREYEESRKEYDVKGSAKNGTFAYQFEDPELPRITIEEPIEVDDPVETALDACVEYAAHKILHENGLPPEERERLKTLTGSFLDLESLEMKDGEVNFEGTISLRYWIKPTQ